MGFHRVTINNCNGYNSYSYYNYTQNYMPAFYGRYYSGFNLFANPFLLFNTAMNLINNSYPDSNAYSNSYPQQEYPIRPQSQYYSNYSYNMPSYNYFSKGSLYDTPIFEAPQTYTPIEPDFNFHLLNENNNNNDAELCIDWPDLNSTQNTSDDNVHFYATKPKAKTRNITPTLHKKRSYKPVYEQFNRNYLNKEFLAKVKKVAKNINCDYEDLLAVMNSESSLDPQRWNGKSAVGLIQFTQIALDEIKRVYGLSYTKSQVARMSALEQLDLVEKFYKCQTHKFKGRKLTAADLYALTYLPGRAHNFILARKGTAEYNENSGLDINKDNVITKDDLEERVSKKRVNLNTFA